MKKRRLARLFTSLLPGALILSALLIGISACEDSPSLSTESQILSYKVGVSPIWDADPVNTAVNLVAHVYDDFDLTNVIPEIKISGGASISPSAKVPQDFSSGEPVEYVVTAEDGKTQTVYTVSVLGDLPTPLLSHVSTISQVKVTATGGRPDWIGTLFGTDENFVILVDDDVDLTNVTPVIALTDTTATISPNNLPQDFTTGPIVYVVTAEDEKTQTVYTISVKHDGEGLIKHNSKIGTVTVSGETQTWTGEAIGTDTNIVVLVEDDIDLTYLAPDIDANDANASISPSVPQDFSSGEPVEYVVTAQDGITKTEYKVTIKHGVALASLAVTPPTKLVYNTGEDLGLSESDLVLTGTWEDGTTQTIYNYILLTPESYSTPGEKTVTLTANKKTASFTIEVKGPETIKIGFPTNGALDVLVYNLEPVTVTNPVTGISSVVDFALSVHDERNPIVAARPDGKVYPRERNISVARGFSSTSWTVDGVAFPGPNGGDPSGNNDYDDDDDYTANDNIITVKAEDYSYDVTHILTFTGIINGVYYSKNITFKVIY
ncbi:hypothetical protein FACS189479_08530 [Spirochaetia bacterium]|nr:hypothetical protein FACS189479_08530 [Spirochaetia bacterium]